MLIDGIWHDRWQSTEETDNKGRFVRATSSVRNWITVDGRAGATGEGGFAAAAGRYHLYVALICPWACRTLMARRLLGLESAISVSVVNPRLTEQGWAFGGFAGATEDHLYGARHLHEIYTRHDKHFTGGVSVPVLWDKERDCMVNNESADILRMLGQGFTALSAKNAPQLYPAQHAAEIESWNQRIYTQLNNGVYRAGFARSQQAYDEAYRDVFTVLDELEARLGERSYLVGDQLSEADIRLFVTLIRFDAAYYGLFKCNRQPLATFPQLWAYVKRIYALPGVAATVNFDHIKRGYYGLLTLNPSGIVPNGPSLNLN